MDPLCTVVIQLTAAAFRAELDGLGEAIGQVSDELMGGGVREGEFRHGEKKRWGNKIVSVSGPPVD